MDGKTVVVTGGAGFLGSHFIRRALAAGAALVVNVDKLTYAGDRRRLADVSEDRRYCFVRGDVASGPEMAVCRVFTAVALGAFLRNTTTRWPGSRGAPAPRPLPTGSALRRAWVRAGRRRFGRWFCRR